MKFTDPEVRLLEDCMAKIRERRPAFADRFYERLFALYPQVVPLFALVDLMSQRDKLIASLALVVSNLRTPSVIEQDLRRLGDRHIGYRVTPDQYPMVEEVLVQTFAEFMGASWTRSHEKAWRRALQTVSQLMIAGTAARVG